MSALSRVRRWSALSLLLAGAPQAYSQSPGAITSLPFPGAAAGSVTKSVSLQLDKYLVSDVATIVGGNVLVQWAPDIQDLTSTFDPSWVAMDLCSIPGAGVVEKDALVIAGSNGVHVMGIRESGSAPNLTRQFAEASSYPTTSPCIAVRAAGHASMNPGFDFAVLTDVGTVLRFFKLQSTGIQQVSTLVLKDASQATLHAKDFRLLRWDDDNVLDVAVETLVGVDVLDVNGTHKWSLHPQGASAHSIAMAVVTKFGRTSEFLAWTVYDGTQSDMCLRVDGTHSGSYEGQSQFVLNGVEPFDLTPGDFDLNGFSDLLVSHRFSSDQVLLGNVSNVSGLGGATFASFASYFLQLAPYGTPFGSYNGSPAIGDLDNDGDDDVFAPCDIAASRYLFRGTALNEQKYRITVTDQGAGDYNFLRTLVRVSLPTDIQASDMNLEVLAFRATYPGHWDVDGIDGYKPTREPTPIVRQVFPINAVPSNPNANHLPTSTFALNWNSNLSNFLYLDSPWTASARLGTYSSHGYYSYDPGEGAVFGGYPTPGDIGGYASSVPTGTWFAIDWLVRIVKVDANGNLTEVYPTKIFTITNDAFYAAELADSSLSTNGIVDVIGLRDIGTGSQGSQSGTGGSGQQRPVDPYQPPPPIPPPSGP